MINTQMEINAIDDIPAKSIDKLVKAVVRGNSAVVVPPPLLLRSSIALGTDPTGSSEISSLLLVHFNNSTRSKRK